MVWLRGPRLLPLVVVAAAIVSACGGTRTAPPSSPPPPAPPPGDPSGSTTVTGNERIGWNQEVAEGTPIAAYFFAAYVDGRRTSLPEPACGAAAGPDGYACSARLPFLTDGQHTIKIVASRQVDGQEVVGDRSEALVVIKVSAASLQPGADEAAAGPAVPRERPPMDRAPGATIRSGFDVAILATGLDPVSDLAALPDGRVLIAERSGRVRVLTGGLVTASIVALPDVARAGGGLISMAAHPRFAANHLLYLLYAADTAHGAMYRLARGRELDGALGELAVLGDMAPARPGGSGAMRFGADGKLYLALADVSDASFPGQTASLLGKVLRLNDDGTTPMDNPRASPIFSSGHRLVEGLAGAADGRLFEAETAATGRINLLRAGARYAARPGDSGDAPASDLGASARPAGMLVYSGRAFQGWRGDLLVARLDGGIDRIPLEGASPGAAASILDGEYGRIRSLVEAPDGSLYFGTANRGTGAGWGDDDRVVRLAPARGSAVPRAARDAAIRPSGTVTR